MSTEQKQADENDEPIVGQSASIITVPSLTLLASLSFINNRPKGKQDCQVVPLSETKKVNTKSSALPLETKGYEEISLVSTDSCDSVIEETIIVFLEKVTGANGEMLCFEKACEKKGSQRMMNYYLSMKKHMTETIKNSNNLIAAARYGHTEAVILLLDRGADIHAKNDSALRGAAKNGHIKTVMLLLGRVADIHAGIDDALRWAAKNGHTKTVMLLLDRGADIHAGIDDALRLAAKNGHTKTVMLLLDKGADIHACDDDALRRAAKNGHTETVTLLLGRGADIHACDDDALRWAAKNGHTKTVMLLLDRGADIHAGNDDGLKRAVENGHPETVRAIREHTANLLPRDINESSFFEVSLFSMCSIL
ncbi:MAG: ankyrin repeat domain-containing protein [Coxiellaceae bacterium]|nr:ankyrin repeat domain-containing protein [Coxiellaceae bacterium]